MVRISLISGDVLEVQRKRGNLCARCITCAKDKLRSMETQLNMGIDGELYSMD